MSGSGGRKIFLDQIANLFVSASEIVEDVSWLRSHRVTYSEEDMRKFISLAKEIRGLRLSLQLKQATLDEEQFRTTGVLSN